MPRDWVYSTTGNDTTGAGTVANPYRTPWKALTMMSSEDTCVGRGGQYLADRSTYAFPAPNGSASGQTIITNYPGEVVEWRHPASGQNIIVGMDVGSRTYEYITIRGSAQDYFIFDMYNLDGSPVQGNGQCIKYAGTASRLAAGNPNKFLVFENLEIRNSKDSGILGYYATDIQLLNLTVHDNGDSGGDHGAYINDSRLTLRGGRYYNNSGWGIHQWNSAITDLLIENSVSYANGRGGIITAGGATGAVTVRNNVAYAHTVGEGWGITTYQSNGTKIYHNACHGNKYGIFLGTASGGGNNAVVSNNISAGNTTGDIIIWSGTSGVTLTDNRTVLAVINNGTGTTNTRTTTGLTVANEWVDPTNATLASRNYDLKAGATSIDPANIVSVGVGIDRYGTLRPQGLRVDAGPHEYRADLWAPPGPWLNSTLDNRTIRFLIRGSDIGDTVTAIKMFLRGRSSGSYTVTGVSIAERDGATLNVVDATNEQVTFGGTWAAGATVPANTEVESDAISIDFNPTNDYFVTFHVATGQAAVYSSADEGATTAWFVIGSDETGTLDWGGLTIDDTRNFPYIAVRLEETIADPIPPSAPSLDVNTSQIVEAGVLHDLNADANDQDSDIVSGYVFCAAGNIGFDYNPSGCAVTHKTS